MSSNGASGGGMMTNGISAIGPDKKKRKLSDKILPQKVRDLVPESQVSAFLRRVKENPET